MTKTCPHGHGDMIQPVNGDPLEPDSPWCPECGHIHGRDCDDGCDYELASCTVCDYSVSDPVELAKLDVFEPANTRDACYKCPDCDAVLHPKISELLNGR